MSTEPIVGSSFEIEFRGRKDEVVVTETPRLLKARRGSRAFTVVHCAALASVYVNAEDTRTECRSCRKTTCVHVRAVALARERAGERRPAVVAAPRAE